MIITTINPVHVDHFPPPSGRICPQKTDREPAHGDIINAIPEDALRCYLLRFNKVRLYLYLQGTATTMTFLTR